MIWKPRQYVVSVVRATLTDEPPAGMIEVGIDGVTVRIGAGAPADTIAAVLRALKAGA